jgi:response regulator RpfG family c-di-GMP phosphodiesterase
MAIIASERGTHFDPDVVDAFLSVSATIERLSAADQEGEHPLRRFS